MVISIVTPERLEAKMLVEACCLGVLLVDVNERCFVFLYCHVYQMFAYAFAEMRRRDEQHLYFIALYADEGHVCVAVVRHNQALNAGQASRINGFRLAMSLSVRNVWLALTDSSHTQVRLSMTSGVRSFLFIS